MVSVCRFGRQTGTQQKYFVAAGRSKVNEHPNKISVFFFGEKQI